MAWWTTPPVIELLGNVTTRFEPGSTFAGYRIESFAGRCGMGVVYQATDLSLDRPVALKLIAPELADDPRFRERFLEEPRLAACWTTRRALAILGQIAGALDAAHRRGLVHRDVKPANVLLDEDEHAYLTDFGITKQRRDAAGETDQAAGTLDYMAPEQIRGEPVDGRADGYALACVLYECLSGAPPFRRATAAETMWAHLQEEPPPLESRGSPEVFYPIGTRNYVRLMSPNSLWGAGHAVLSKRLGLERVYLLVDDGDVTWKTVLTDPFRKTARRLGVRVAGSEAFNPRKLDVDALAERVERSGAEGVVLGAMPFDRVPALVRALGARLGRRAPIMVGNPWASFATVELFDQAGPAMRQVYVASADVPRTAGSLTAAARRIAREVDAEQLGVLEAAQATELVLQAIAGSDGTRASVLERLRARRERDGILGTFRFDDKGDMTLGYMTILRFTAPVESSATALEGAVVDRVVQVPPSWTD
jgi:hypothetical protein